MPILTLRYQGEVLAKQRPRATVQGGRARVYNPPLYAKWLQSKTLETMLLNTDNVQGVRCDLLLYEFGLADLGKDGDNTEGAIQDAIVESKLFLGDTFLSIPIHTTLVFPTPLEKQFIQVTICYQGDETDYQRYFIYRNKRELLALDLIKIYRSQ
jgi:hypothetical protein